jgi:hypothetical protein
MAQPARPHYEAPRPALVGFAFDLLLKRRRSFVNDARRVCWPRTHMHASSQVWLTYPLPVRSSS